MTEQCGIDSGCEELTWIQQCLLYKIGYKLYTVVGLFASMEETENMALFSVVILQN